MKYSNNLINAVSAYIEKQTSVDVRYSIFYKGQIIKVKKRTVFSNIGSAKRALSKIIQHLSYGYWETSRLLDTLTEDDLLYIGVTRKFIPSTKHRAGYNDYSNISSKTATDSARELREFLLENKIIEIKKVINGIIVNDEY